MTSKFKFWRRGSDNPLAYHDYLTYSIVCRGDRASCKLALDSVKKKYRNDIFIHEPIVSTDPTVKRVDYIVEVADNQQIRKEFYEELNPYVESMISF